MKDTTFEIGRLCREHGITIGVAESCTGGLIAAALTDVAGASAWFKGGIVSYAEEIKVALLGVPADLIQKAGVVSGVVAEAMAKGARQTLSVDVAVSVTGLAGPEGDGINPVGTVFVGYASRREQGSRVFHFEGDRGTVRTQAREAALGELLRFLRAPMS